MSDDQTNQPGDVVGGSDAAGGRDVAGNSDVAGGSDQAQLPPAVMPPQYVQARQSTGVFRPLGVTIVMVLCLIAGIGGLFSSCFATAGYAFGEAITMMAAASPDDPQMQMQARMQESNHMMLIPNIIMTIFGAVLSGCFLAGGLGLLKAKPWTLKLIRRTLLAAVVFECLRGVLVVYMQVKNAPIMDAFYREMAEKNQGPDMSQMMGAFMWVGMVAWGLWAIAKIGLMIWGRVYLGGQAARDYIAEMNA